MNALVRWVGSASDDLVASERSYCLRSVLLSACLLFGFAAGVNATEPSHNHPITTSFFGLHIHHLDVPYPNGVVSQWPSIRFGAWRLWGAYVNWYDLEPAKGDWRFDRLDSYVAHAQRAGVDILLTLGRTPRWASARPDESCGALMGCAAEPRDIRDWEDYVRTVALRYRGVIRYYEVWNEPAFSEVERVLLDSGRAAQYFSGSARTMSELAASAYRVLKAVDPTIEVVSPSVTVEGNGLRRLEAYFRAGGAKSTDIVGFHFYLSPPEQIFETQRALMALMARYGLARAEVWNTEMGYVFASPEHKVPAAQNARRWNEPLDQDVGAAFVSRALILSAASGISRVFWFNWDGQPPHPTMGLAANAGRTETPMLQAFVETQRWMRGASISSAGREPRGIWVCALTKGGVRAWIVWAEQGEPTWSPPFESRVGQIRSLAGTTRVVDAVAAGPLVIGRSPQLVVEGSDTWGDSSD